MGLPHLTDAIVLLLFFCHAQASFSQLTYTVQVVDVSDKGSPLEIAGAASFTETKRQNAFQTSGRLQILLKNASDKDIILLRAQVREAGPHGPITDHEINRDHFFWGALSAGSSIRLITDERHPASLARCCGARPHRRVPFAICGVCRWVHLGERVGGPRCFLHTTSHSWNVAAATKRDER